MSAPKIRSIRNHCSATAWRLNNSGFSRVDLLVSLFVCGFLIVLLVSTLSYSRRDAGLKPCQNNLRQLGIAFRLFNSTESTPRYPNIADANPDAPYNPYSEPPQTGGGAWGNFAAVAHEIRSPQMLVCPVDAPRKRALSRLANLSFVSGSNNIFNPPPESFMHPNNRENVLSYFVAVEADEEYPLMILMGDRNVGDNFSEKDPDKVPLDEAMFDSAKLKRPVELYRRVVLNGVTNAPTVAFDESIHEKQGNIVFADGHVEQLNTAHLRKALKQSDDPNQRNAVLTPKR